MKNANRLTRQQYAAKYDEHAGSFYKFALCVIGDKKQAEAVMAKLFCEGYAYAEQENFVWHMLDVLRRILESYPYDADGYREYVKNLFPDPMQNKLVELLCKMTVSQRAVLLQRIMFEEKELIKSV